MVPMWFLSCLLGLVHLSLGQVPEGTPCYTSRDEYGLCTNIKQCNVLLELLKTQSSDPDVRNYLRSSICGYAGTTPIVCCPQVTVKSSFDLVDANDTDTKEINHNKRAKMRHHSNKTENNNMAELLSVPDCGFSNNSNTRVVGGVPAQLGTFPWIVALGYRNPSNPKNPKWLCGASLITNKHILTAAHCVHNRNDLYMARIGEYDLYNDDDGASPEDIALVKAKIHEDYSPVTFTNDIAILTLSRAPQNSSVWPICLPHSEPYRSNRFLKYQPMVAGWGAIYFNGPSSSVLMKASVPVVDNSRCMKAYENKSVIDDRVLCAGWPSGEKDACQGDSGGPLMYGKIDGADVRFYQIGVVSYGFRCADPEYPGVYTRVTYYIDWIRKNLN